MSLELAIQENTAALRELIARLTTVPAAAQVAKVEKETTAKKSEQVKAAPAATAPSTPSEDGNADAKITYEVLSKEFLTLVNSKGRDLAVDVLTQLGVPAGKKLSHLTEDQYPAAMSVIRKAMA